MGKMNRIYPKLANGDVGRDCEVEKWCGEPAYQLSSSRKPLGHSVNGKQRYERIIRYKCLNGHRFDKTDTVTEDLLAGVGAAPTHPKATKERLGKK